MKRKLAIISNNIEKPALQKCLNDDFVVVTLEEAKKINDSNIQLDTSYLQLEYAKPLEINVYGNKPFVCKGKHQYREVGTNGFVNAEENYNPSK